MVTQILTSLFAPGLNQYIGLLMYCIVFCTYFFFAYREPSGARAADKTLPLPVNFERMIWNAQGEYNIDKSKPSDLGKKKVNSIYKKPKK